MLTPLEYVKFFSLSIGTVVLFLLPVVYAAIVAHIPSKLSNRFLFALICGALSYGTAALIDIVVFIPIGDIATYLAPGWHDAGYSAAPMLFSYASEYSGVLEILAGGVVAIWLPVYMRRSVWSKLYPSSN